jgi:hypothetical protein
MNIGPIGASPPPSQVRADAQEEAVEQQIERADHGQRKSFLARLLRRRSR